ncbi:MAG: hypothetical protein U9Q73_03185 [Nanoarchaeota archaeon]|nr:hypothetical protein [Nanoarchaeota archaeon]
MALDSDIQKILELSNKSSSAQSEAFEKLKQLQEKIRGGDSTGDKIRDFVIANLGTLSPEAEEPYRETEARLKNRAGSQILVVKQSESIQGCPGITPPAYIDPRFIGVDTKLKLGILTSGLELDIKEGSIILPTDKHAIKYDRYSRSKWKLKEGPISLNWYEFANLGKEVHRRMTPLSNDLSAHFEHGLTLHLEEEVEKYFGGDRHLDTSYVEALNLLGHEAPERFIKKYDGEVYRTRVGVINKLEELTSREAKLNYEIRSIYGSMEDEDYAGVVSIRPIMKLKEMKLKETREGIQRYLKQGIELGMHRGDLKIEQKPGMEINVPAYISGMCGKYQVEIPN